MENFSIELAAEKIYDTRTKDYFQEVIKSYNNSNYRSAIVMLWTVVICDVVYKLQNSRDIYNDQTAKSILEEIETKQKNNPNGSEWEELLIKEVKKRTKLLNNAEEENLNNLRKNRHLSAHPVLDQADILFRPNRETVRALIRNTLEGVLVKHPILLMSKDLVQDLVNDLEANKDLLTDNESLKRYLEAKYLKNLHPAVENNLFRSLWKLVFFLVNTDTDNNRAINFRVLNHLYLRRKSELEMYIQDHQDWFSKVDTNERLIYLVQFTLRHLSIYNLLNDSARILIRNYIESDINLYAKALFLNNDVKEHLKQIQQQISIEGKITDKSLLKMNIETRRKLLKIASEHQEKEFISLFLNVAIEEYGNSGTFDYADKCFDDFVQPCLDFFDKDSLIRILEAIEKKDQTYRRKRSTADHIKLKERCDEVLGANFDYSPYPYFIASLK